VVSGIPRNRTGVLMLRIRQQLKNRAAAEENIYLFRHSIFLRRVQGIFVESLLGATSTLPFTLVGDQDASDPLSNQHTPGNLGHIDRNVK
jgi:hypothetical protein